MISNYDTVVLKNEQSYCAMIGTLSTFFMKAHLSSPYRKELYHCRIMIDDKMTVSYNNQPESAEQRLHVLYATMLPPRGGIFLDISSYEESLFDPKCKVGMKHTTTQAWTMVNNPFPKNKVTLNLPPKKLREHSDGHRYFTKKDIQSKYKGKLTLVDYDTPIGDLYNTLCQSKLHICYQGGTAWISLCMGIPTIIVHPNLEKKHMHLKNRIFGQEVSNINILNDKGQVALVRKHPHEYHTSIANLDKMIEKLT